MFVLVISARGRSMDLRRRGRHPAGDNPCRASSPLLRWPHGSRRAKSRSSPWGS